MSTPPSTGPPPPPAPLLLADWLRHWVETIAAPSVRPKSLAGYRTAVYQHLIPGLGQFPLVDMQPEHVEAFYARLLAAGLAPGTVHQVHRTLRTALGQARLRHRTGENVAALARAPRVPDTEVEPFTVIECQAILQATKQIPNGARFAIALALGLRQGEALGLRWDDLALDGPGPATLTVRRALQRVAWTHGCAGQPCGLASRHCPRRHGGGLLLVAPKSRAGRRTMVLPEALAAGLREHRERAEQAGIVTSGSNAALVFARSGGRPLDPRADLLAWKALLKQAGVRTARLHDARHTAATLLLIQGTDPRTVMDLLGWSQVAMTRRYQHVVNQLRVEAAARIGAVLWPDPPGTQGGTAGPATTPPP